jgi:CDP-glycerol glycerophosphotransferase (TagB/SpsB family)
MKFNKSQISHYFIFSISALNYFIAIFFRKTLKRQNENILLFGHKLTGNLEAIFLEERLSNNKFLYITLNYQEYSRLKKIYGDKILCSLNVFQLTKGLMSKTIIASHGIFLHKIILKLGINTIHCGHAIHGSIPENKLKDRKFYELFNEVWLHSEYDKTILTKERGCGPSNLKTFGYARNQKMLEDYRYSEKIKAKNSITDKKIILYAPTSDRNNDDYRKSIFSITNIKFYEQMVKALLNSDIILLIKSHLNDQISQDIKSLIKASENIKFQDELNLTNDYESLVISDVLITDYSTIYVDYLLLEKPIFLINNPNPFPKKWVMSSILKNVQLPKISDLSDFENLFENLKYQKLETKNIKTLKNNIYKNQDLFNIISEIQKRI